MSTPPGAHLPEHPDFLWRTPEPKRSYDVVVIGGGGHGLATAHYLAENHGITNVAVLEKGWLAGGNMARNTTIIRSNYLWDDRDDLRARAEAVGGAQGGPRLPDPVLQRGVLNLAHTEQDVRDSVRRVEANRLNGVDAEWVGPDEVARSARSSTSRPTSATPCRARPTSRARASPSTTTWPGASPAAPTRPGST